MDMEGASTSMYAPIILFTYNRPWHTRQTVEALLKNDFADKSELIVFSDGPKDSQDKQKVEAVRQYVKSLKGFDKVTIIERSENLGLGKSIIDGISEVINKYEEIIVLEDDLVTSPFFLRYMNEALELYKHEEKVISVHGYIYPVIGNLPVTFFLRGADCWGWGTWKRGWALFEENGQKLLENLKKDHLTNQFDFNGAYGYTKMLKDQIKGRNSSWAVRWYASAFINDCLTLYPGVSLVRHIGNDGTGTNFDISKNWDTKLSETPVNLIKIEPIENIEAREIVSGYLRSMKEPLPRLFLNLLKKKVNQILFREMT